MWAAANSQRNRDPRSNMRPKGQKKSNNFSKDKKENDLEKNSDVE